MDFSVNNFNLRLRSIRLGELILAIIIASFISIILATFIPIYAKYDDLFVLTMHILLLIFFIYALRGTVGLKDNFRDILKPSNKKEILYLLVLNYFFALMLIAVISVFTAVLISLSPGSSVTVEFSSADIGPIYYFLDLLTGIIGAPIIEELIFRGVIFTRLRPRLGIIWAMIISSALFALLHDPSGMISAFVFGLCMCVIYLKTDNIIIPMIIHCLNNTLSYGTDLLQLNNFLFIYPLSVVMLIASIIAFVGIIIYLSNGVKQARSEGNK
ncbi:CPBP family intramembrane glutamic endopeptidase [uncultured Methanobrevibacter sp.]|uniref:CPBP family intramembrane glutamic endopeptidase n=1 Tax=uncultured Methanobrevibacter sp. TaxID=253161 RepID=UPI0025EB794B|nr:type II CAAX endopeptidase family protein [uncultured Methanobrevibacter sp.]